MSGGFSCACFRAVDSSDSMPGLYVEAVQDVVAGQQASGAHGHHSITKNISSRCKNNLDHLPFAIPTVFNN